MLSLFSLVSIIQIMLHTHHHHKNSRLSGQAVETLGTSNQNQAFSSVGQHWTQTYSHIFPPTFKVLLDKKFESLSTEAHENFYRNWLPNQHFRTTGVDRHVTKTGINNENTKQKTQEKFFQEAITLSSKTKWQNIKSTWENNKNKPRKQAVALFRLNTGHDCLAAHLYRHDCLAAHLYRIKVLSYNHCSIRKTKKYNNGQISPPPVPKTGSNL